MSPVATLFFQWGRCYSGFVTPLYGALLGGVHSLVRSVMEDNDLVGNPTATIWSPVLFAADVMDDFSAFLNYIPSPV